MVDRRTLRFLAYVSIGLKEQCWPWHGSIAGNGYGHVTFKGERTTAHRIAYKLFIGPIVPGLVILHSCDNPLCCNPFHLTPGTQKQNVHDMIQKRRNYVFTVLSGEAHGRCKVTDAQCAEIRQRAVNGERQIALAKAYGLGQSHISRIVRGHNR